ncbi:hypothetical protein [Frankia sp. AgB32]|uniref:hypothetical protein n=1 Tax=Frankia sp. AgB32 TaxID=631119 RepID=UPI0020105AE2|nr:hypothetical protein [Frankia sp. AgB32]MCK9893751.1 hypothetical protein [Frankia sp. AgB32]
MADSGRPSGSPRDEGDHVPGAVRAWWAAGEAGDPAAAAACLADVVVVDLPKIGRYRFAGHRSMWLMLMAAFDRIEDLRHESVSGADDQWTLSFQARLCGHLTAATQRLTLDPTGHIHELMLPGPAPMDFRLAMERFGALLVSPFPRRPGQRRAHGRPRPHRTARVPLVDRPDPAAEPPCAE